LASDAIKLLKGHTSQRNLEHLLGLSPGYLCRLRAQGGNPSPALVLLLSLIALDPATHLLAIARFWQGQSSMRP
jgi:hypothetical protein